MSVSAIYYSGTVVDGMKNGRKFGFPTANILLDEYFLPPDYGVYAVEIHLEGKPFRGMLYVGTRPTLGLEKVSMEIYIFDFNENIYGHTVKFKILEKVRGEKKFETVDQLIKQIKDDQDAVSHFFNRRSDSV